MKPVICSTLAGLLLSGTLVSSLHAHEVGETQATLGQVVFPVSCQRDAAKMAERGLALLHHMTYEAARAAFDEATAADPDCAMAYWGAAMSYIHPLWSDPPDKQEYENAQALLHKARQQGEKTDWERAYISALEAYFSGPWSADERPRLARYADAWAAVYEKYPEDIEAAAFYALALLGTADPADKDYEKQKQAAAIAAGVIEQQPNHPGALHYTIHAYDYPPLAHRAQAVAERYDRIAPANPHALHMPTHIFTREGMWQASIEGNLKSAEAARQNPVNGKVSLHYLHALDYLVYAYLQRAEDEAAHAVLDTLRAIDAPLQPHVASAYALAAIPARLALERQQWKLASGLEARVPDAYPWDDFPAMEAISYFARALGAAHTGDTQQARADLEKLASLKARLPASAAYWATQIEVQRLSALAWLEYYQDRAQGLETMQKAAMLEAGTEKHPVTPGEVLPAHELLADMLRDMARYEQALEKYQQALERNPRRFNSLYGAGYAAEQLGEAALARDYYRQLVDMTREGNMQLEPIRHARAYLEREPEAAGR